MKFDVAVIGGGSAGLMAAETAAAKGCRTAVFDASPSVGRKFLVAGRGGLNLTHGCGPEEFASRYGGGAPENFWRELLEKFGPQDSICWSHELGVETFQATSKRIYPQEMKAAKLLRGWVQRMKQRGVQFFPKHRWSCLRQTEDSGWNVAFSDQLEISSSAVVFALGGASWPRTGSDGGWLETFRRMGISCAELVASNCGWETAWPPEVLALEGTPLKNLSVSAGGSAIFGELMVTRYGLEGGAVYALGGALRTMAAPRITIDFKPTFSAAVLAEKISGAGNRTRRITAAQRRWKLSAAVTALLASREWETAGELAQLAKQFPVDLLRPRPIAEAISSAGGIRWDELDDRLMLRKFPGVFTCGEMLDWDAPTGGYLMQGCFSTGWLAGTSAAQFVGDA